ncbi:hypothetical protein [Fictibacillus sp. 18YEL24]|uniref:hypothetical protein n=1 Tax=Fictibacillus sp. 18YEL24 TaxID=2745875 RepID=UPI0018CDCB82|nr:hypothetical protein [Fictibacillus sp. 18YEL24]MBH0170572.1 hypothetical protein [Fictibacillus sp. 18YEL24]
MSLFNNGSCCGNGNTAGTTKSKCGGCVCELLNQLANARMTGNFCTMGQQQVVQLILKGASDPLGVAPGQATDFTVVSFDPETCCAVFSFRQGGPGAPSGGNETRTIVLDCRCICGIICVPERNGGSTVGL